MREPLTQFDLGVERHDVAVIVEVDLALVDHLLDEVVGLLLQLLVLGLEIEGLAELFDLLGLFCQCFVQASLLPFGFCDFLPSWCAFSMGHKMMVRQERWELTFEPTLSSMAPFPWRSRLG